METKKEKIVSAVATIGIILTLLGATYAYFASLVDAGKITDVEITANTVDVFSFETGDPISLNINQENFASGKGNQTDSTFARAMLSANNKTNTATEHYYLYLSISNNTFTYSKESTYPEILVKITDQDGNELVDNDVEGLTHKTVIDAQGNTVTGFDVTEKEGTITILNNREITTTSTKSEMWTFTFTFVNYDFNQATNAGGNFSARVLIKKNGAIMNDVCKSGDKLSDCIVAMYGIDDNLYYHGENLENGANDNSYRYAGGNNHPDYYACTYNGKDVYDMVYNNVNYTLEGNCDSVYQITSSSGDITYFDKGMETFFDMNNPVEVEWDAENEVCVTQTDGEQVFLPDLEEADESLCTGVAYLYDNLFYFLGIEYAGTGKATLYEKNVAVNNFVCFGSDDEICPNDNLYRIIGIFDDRIRLIKADYVTNEMLGTDTSDYGGTYDGLGFGTSYYQGSVDISTIARYYWNYENYSTYLYTKNAWNTSELNKTHLNKNFINYLNNIDTKWANMIDITTWKVGGFDLTRDDSSIIYINEIINPSTRVTSTYTSKIGLMYVSDYGFAASPSAWTTSPYDYNENDTNENKITNENWMYMGLTEWTMTRMAASNSAEHAFDIYFEGEVLYANVNTGNLAIRPVFHLLPNVKYVSGMGTRENPIILE